MREHIKKLALAKEEKFRQYIKTHLDEIRILVEEGKQPTEILKVVGISFYPFKKYLKELDPILLERVNMNGNKNFKTKEKLLISQNWDQIVNWIVKEKQSAQQIGDKLKLSAPTIHKRVKQQNLELYNKMFQNGRENKKIGVDWSNSNRHFRKVTLSMLNEMLQLSKNGMGVDLIGKKLGIHGTTVMIHLRKLLGDKEYQSRHNKKKFTTYWSGRFYKNNRGDTLQSSLEEDVADWLFENNIKYEMRNTLWLGKKRYHPDFELIDLDMYIEIFGMSNQGFYKIKMDKKIEDYKKHNIKCIYLYYENFFRRKDYKTILEKELKR